jgi:hypothetical protein
MCATNQNQVFSDRCPSDRLSFRSRGFCFCFLGCATLREGSQCVTHPLEKQCGMCCAQLCCGRSQNLPRRTDKTATTQWCNSSAIKFFECFRRSRLCGRDDAPPQKASYETCWTNYDRLQALSIIPTHIPPPFTLFNTAHGVGRVGGEMILVEFCLSWHLS